MTQITIRKARLDEPIPWGLLLKADGQRLPKRDGIKLRDMIRMVIEFEV